MFHPLLHLPLPPPLKHLSPLLPFIRKHLFLRPPQPNPLQKLVKTSKLSNHDPRWHAYTSSVVKSICSYSLHSTKLPTSILLLFMFPLHPSSDSFPTYPIPPCSSASSSLPSPLSLQLPPGFTCDPLSQQSPSQESLPTIISLEITILNCFATFNM